MFGASPLKKLQGHAPPSLFPSASEEQLDGFLHVKYQMHDTSLISHYIMRPYWRFVSSKCPNIPPGILIFSGLNLTILNLLLLSYCDPVFSNSAPVGVLVLCGVLHLISLTCVGVDAGGRLTRREDSSQSAYLSMEYIDQAVDSVHIPVKTVCLLHLIGVGSVGLLCHQGGFWFFVTVLGFGLCRQWQNYKTGIFRSSAVFDGLDIGLLAGYFVRAVVTGYSGDAPTEVPGWMHTASVIVFLGVILYIIRVTVRAAGDLSPWDILTNRSALIPFFLLAAAQLSWFSFPDYPTLFPYICWSTGIVYSNIVWRWILSQMSSKPETQWNLLVLIVLVTDLMNISGCIPPDLRARSLLIVCIVCTIWQAIYMVCIINDLLYRVLLALFAAFFRHAAKWMTQLFGKSARSTT